ncbi:MAG: ATP-binding cassette domain-containing protein [Acidimicrobiia bacterium]
MRRSHAVVAAVAVCVLAITQLFPGSVPLGVVAKGALFGTATGLLAVGLVLIYRTTRIINFAYGAMGSLGGAVAAGLAIGQDVPWLVAAPIGVVAGIAVGALVERVVVRRFADAPRLVLTVATIGLAQLLGGLALYMPGWLDAPDFVPRVETPLTDNEFSIDAVVFTGNDILLLAIVPVVLIALGWFLLRTEAGIAVRGMAENMDRARLLGIPVTRLSLLLWSLAGGLAALTVVLRAPTEGVPLSAAAGPVVLLPALAAAVVVGMGSLWGAFLAGVGLGVIDQLVLWNIDRTTPTSVVLLGVIVVALLVQRRPISRALAGDSSWSIVGVGHALPRALAHLREVRAARVAVGLIVAAGVLLLPALGSDSQVNFGTLTLAYGLVAVSLVMLTGWGGAVSLGQVGIMGVGAVVTANLIADENADLFLALGLAAIAGGIAALVLGIPALRVSGQFLAVTTLAFAVAMELYVLNPANHGSLLPAAYERPELWGVVDLSDERWLYALALVLLGLVVFVVRNLRAARAGRVISATRDNARGASAAGISPVAARLSAFVFAGIVAGVAGGVHAVALRGIGQSTYPAATSLLVFSMAVIGGVSSVGGALAGVVAIQWLGYLFPKAQLLLTGVGLLVILMLVPGGFAQVFERLRDRFAGLAARRHGIELKEEVETVDQPVDDTGSGVIVRDATNAGIVLGSVRRERLGSDLLAMEGVEAAYGSLQVLFGVDASAERNELLALLGTNGSGKSTLLKTVSGLLPPTHGRVVFDGQDITGQPAEEIARRGLSMVPGGHGVFPALTVAENLRLATWMLRHDREAAERGIAEVTAMFPVLDERRDQLAGDLSGGEQQQLSLAMAFVTRPKLLLVDELSLGLAPTVVDRLVEKVREIHAAGTTVVLIEQSVNVALLLCNRALFLEKGQVRFRGPTAGLLDRPDILRSVFIGDTAAVPRHAGASGDERPAVEHAARGLTLECRGVTKRFGGITAVDKVDLVVPPATTIGLIGHNGAGKTTLFDVLTGFLPADGGRVTLGGVDITNWAPHQRAIAQVGRTFQEALLYPSLRVSEAVAVALERHLANRDPLAAALRLPASTESELSAFERVDQLIELLNLGPYADRPTGELSTGTRRIVELACLLAQDPALVLLDEPSAGVAQRESEALGPLLRRVQEETGCSMMVVEHDIDLLATLCERFVALEQGRVIASGTPDEVLGDPAVIASYLGTNEDVMHRSGDRQATTPGPGSPSV